jgi:hypothetical protein
MLLLRARVAGVRPRRLPEESELDILAPDEDVLVESEAPRADEEGSLLLRRPIADVQLGHIGWSGTVDHAALQDAIACAPVTGSAVPSWLALAGLDTRAGGTSAPSTDENDGSALEVRLSRADLDLGEALARTADGGAFRGLAFALVLPERIVGASAASRAVLADVLAAYRRACLAHAWATRLELPRMERFARERDEAAVALLSALRAVLGER